MDATSSYSQGLPPEKAAKYEDSRRWWSFRLRRFSYLVPEGSYHPYVPAYQDHSCFGDVLAPQIKTVIDCFRLSHIASSVPFRPRLSHEILGRRIVKPLSLTRTRTSTADIRLHQPLELSQGSRDFSDNYRLIGYKKYNEMLSYEPRITIIPRYPSATGRDWSPNTWRVFGNPPIPLGHDKRAGDNPMDVDAVPNEAVTAFQAKLAALLESAELLDVHAQACSLRAQLALHSPHLAHLTWDVGLFKPTTADERAGFANHSLAAALRILPSLQHSPIPHLCRWGAMLLLRPITNLIHLQLVVLLQGYMFPSRLRSTENGIVHHVLMDFAASVERLKAVVERILSFAACTVSHSGIRLLTDRPEDYDIDARNQSFFSANGSFVLPHPLGVEISLPVDAYIPAEMLHEVARNRFTRHYVPSALRATGGTGTAWIAAAIEFEFTRRGFTTVFRTFHYDETGFRVRLFLFDQDIERTPGCTQLMIMLGIHSPPLQQHEHASRDMRHCTGLRMSTPFAFNRLFWPILFPLTDMPISRWSTPQFRAALLSGNPQTIAAMSSVTYFEGGVGRTVLPQYPF